MRVYSCQRVGKSPQRPDHWHHADPVGFQGVARHVSESASSHWHAGAVAKLKESSISMASPTSKPGPHLLIAALAVVNLRIPP